jgi:PAS domain S-box-containing protein
MTATPKKTDPSSLVENISDVTNFGDITKQKLTPRSNWSEMDEFQHFVQFYESDVFLLDSLSGFVAAGLATGDGCIVITTKGRRESLEERLKANGLDLATAHTRDEYISLDAVETLSKFMVDGLPEPERFAEVIGSVIAQAAQGRRHVRIFGDMVALLWTEENPVAAIRLEELWNDLRDKIHPFSLFCAYSMHDFDGEVYGMQFSEICQQHSQVLPDESYTALVSSDERLRAITLLQQKANSLEAEIAERKVAEKRLQASETRYRRLFETSKDGILIVDSSTHTITDANPAMTELLGYTHKQLLGQELWQIGLFQDRATYLEALRELQEKEFLCETLALQTRDGQHLDVEFVCTLYQVNRHKAIQCNIRDITERKELERRKDEFISMASHELKTPITALKGFTQLLQRRFQSRDDEDSLRFLARMNAQINKLTKLISDLLDISKMQTGQLEYGMEPFDLDVLAQEIVENVQGTTQTHRLILDREKTAEVHIFGDKDRIGQVLINLLANAIKYSSDADRVIIRIASDGEDAQVSVQDFGFGITEAYQQKIFERFYQVSEPAEKTYPGLGIGLHIAREIITRHQGRLWVQSQKGAGSTFFFRLPLLEKASQKA